MENKTKNKLNGAKVQESTGYIHQRSCATILISHWSVKRRYQNQNLRFTDAEEEIGN